MLLMLLLLLRTVLMMWWENVIMKELEDWITFNVVLNDDDDEIFMKTSFRIFIEIVTLFFISRTRPRTFVVSAGRVKSHHRWNSNEFPHLELTVATREQIHSTKCAGEMFFEFGERDCQTRRIFVCFAFLESRLLCYVFWDLSSEINLNRDWKFFEWKTIFSPCVLLNPLSRASLIFLHFFFLPVSCVRIFVLLSSADLELFFNSSVANTKKKSSIE